MGKLVQGLMVGLVEGLCQLHSEGSFHGDISLEHVFLSRNQELKIADKAFLGRQSWAIRE